MERIDSRFGEAKYLTLRAAGKTAVCAAIAAVEPYIPYATTLTTGLIGIPDLTGSLLRIKTSHQAFPGTIKKPLCEGLFLWRPGEDSNL